MKRKSFSASAAFAAATIIAAAGWHADEYKPTIVIEETDDWAEVNGDILSVSQDRGIIEINAYVDAERTIYNQETIYVMKGARIFKGGRTARLEDLDPTDRITVRYLIGPDGRRQAHRIWVEDN